MADQPCNETIQVVEPMHDTVFAAIACDVVGVHTAKRHKAVFKGRRLIGPDVEVEFSWPMERRARVRRKI